MEKNCVVILDVKNAHNIKTNKEFKKTESVYEELEGEVHGELLFSGYTAKMKQFWRQVVVMVAQQLLNFQVPCLLPSLSSAKLICE